MSRSVVAGQGKGETVIQLRGRALENAEAIIGIEPWYAKNAVDRYVDGERPLIRVKLNHLLRVFGANKDVAEESVQVNASG
jgi:hypothetical protein